MIYATKYTKSVERCHLYQNTWNKYLFLCNSYNQNSICSRIGGMQMGVIVLGMEFIFVLGNFVKSSSWELMNSGLTAVKPPWN